VEGFISESANTPQNAYFRVVAEPQTWWSMAALESCFNQANSDIGEKGENQVF
jgi:hypothetical protein